MRMLCMRCGLVLASLTLVGAASGEPFKRKANEGDIVVRPMSEKEKTVDPALIEGKKGEAADFKASFFSAFEGHLDLPRCTATLIGPRAVLTAAHCVGDGKKIVLKISANVFEGTCRHHPNYKSDDSADFALCAMDEAIPVPPERISFDSSLTPKGKVILLAGYGCVRRNVTGGNDGVFRIGRSLISEVSGKVKVQSNGASKLAKYYFSTESAPDQEAPAIICPGDSGGAAFCLQDVTKEAGARVVCGINSAVECVVGGADDCTQTGDTSYLASTFAAAKWFKEAEQLKLCGRDDEISNLCHP